MPDLNFDNHNTLYATHGLHAYAAKCPPQLVRYGLRYYSKPGEVVLDPMSGSGTTLVEARLTGRHAIGYDIDPLACLIAQVKSRVVSDQSVEQAYEILVKRSLQDIAALRSVSPPADVRRRAEPPDFANRDYWFTPEVTETLAILGHHITHIDAPIDVRDFFWVAYSSLILSKTSVANARDIIHSRHHFWCHDKSPDVLGRFDTRIKAMRKQMGEFRRMCNATLPTKGESRLGDARRMRLKDETIDLVFTSPPYATALDYPRAHFLAVAWMQPVLGVNLEEYLAKAQEYVGSERGRQPKGFCLNAQLAKHSFASSVLTELAERSPSHAKLTQRYFGDMNQVIRKIACVLKFNRHAIIVVCPSHIRKVEVPTQEVLIELGCEHGLRLKRKYTRTINERRRILPYLKEAFGSRMDTEYVLVFQRKM